MLNKYHSYNMKRINKIRVNNFKGMIKETEKGETLIKKIQRILDENEPLTDGAPMIYTPKQAGVRDDCNIRTDKWTLAMNAMDRVNNYKLNEYLKREKPKRQRQPRIKQKEEQPNQIQLETTSRVRLRTLYAKRADVIIYVRFLKPKKRSTHIAYNIK